MARILVIDDSPLFRLVLREILTKGGNEVYEASTVEEGLRIFRTISPDLVFKDLIMEDSNPLEVIKDLIRYSPTAKIVICSTEGRSEEHTSELQSRPHLVC